MRKILHRDGTTAVFDGTVVITRDWFDESGEIRMSGAQLQSSRRYRLIFDDDKVQVQFTDGRPFVNIGTHTAQSIRHSCGDDDYRGRYFFADDGTWVEAWEVIGPRKSYRSIARYCRA